MNERSKEKQDYIGYKIQLYHWVLQQEYANHLINSRKPHPQTRFFLTLSGARIMCRPVQFISHNWVANYYLSIQPNLVTYLSRRISFFPSISTSIVLHISDILLKIFFLHWFTTFQSPLAPCSLAHRHSQPRILSVEVQTENVRSQDTMTKW